MKDDLSGQEFLHQHKVDEAAELEAGRDYRRLGIAKPGVKGAALWVLPESSAII